MDRFTYYYIITSKSRHRNCRKLIHQAATSPSFSYSGHSLLHMLITSLARSYSSPAFFGLGASEEQNGTRAAGKDKADDDCYLPPAGSSITAQRHGLSGELFPDTYYVCTYIHHAPGRGASRCNDTIPARFLPSGIHGAVYTAGKVQQHYVRN